MVETFDWEANVHNIPFFYHMVSGSLAGISEHCFAFPFDTLKVSSIQTYAQAESTSRVKSFETISLLTAKTHTNLWNGVSAIILGCIPAHAAYFSVYEISKSHFGIDSQNSFHFYYAMLTGASAAFSHDLMMTPMDGILEVVVKQRTQLQGNIGPFEMFKKIIEQEGVIALYRGLPVTIMMNMPYAMIFMSIFSKLELVYYPDKVTTVGRFTCAGVAAAVAAGLTTPMDVVKTRLQTELEESSYIGSKRAKDYRIKYRNFSKTVEIIYKNEGFRGFSRGFLPRIMFTLPGEAVSWSTYEYIKGIIIR